MLNRQIVIAYVLVIITGLMTGLYFASAWPSINNSSNSFTLTGTLEPGVEAGCVILRAENRTQYLLIDWYNYPPPGTEVTVTGYLDYNVASYCMQGETAIHVVSISTMSTSISYGTATASNATMISGSIEQSTTISGVSITTSGYLYKVVESPQCYPQCGMPSFLLTYLYIPPGTGCATSMGCYPPPRYYRLLNLDSSPFWTTAPNGTYAVSVTGILVTPSSWNCNSFYVPKICMIGDIYMQNLTYATPTQSITSTSSTTTNETGTQFSPIPGFELPSILTGFILGLAILAGIKHRLHQGQENTSSR